MIKIAKQLFQNPLKHLYFPLNQRALTKVPIQYLQTKEQTKVHTNNISFNKQLRINLDYYASENFRFSFLEIQMEDQELEQYLADLKPYFIQNLEDLDRLRELSKELHSFLKSNSAEKNTILRDNIVDYKVFQKKIKNNSLFNEKSFAYEEIISTIKDMLSKEKLELAIDFNHFGPLSRLILKLCVLDLGLWKQIIQHTFLFPEKFTDSHQLAQTLLSIKLFFNRFHFIENTETKFARYHFSFPENELPSLLNRRLISSFFIKFDRFYIDKHEIRLVNKNSFCVILSLACDIVQKLSKVSFVNNFEERRFLKKFEPLLLNNLDELTPENSLSIFSNYVNLGINNKEFVNKFINHFINLPSDVEMQRFLESLLRSWKYSGKYDEEIYLKSVKKILVAYINNPKNAVKLPSLSFELIMIKLKDIDIWNQLMVKLSELDFEKLYLFQKKSLHLVFQHLKTQKDMELDLSSTLKLQNSLSLFCIGAQNNFDFSLLNVTLDEGEINCCDHHTITKFTSQYTEMVASKLASDPKLKRDKYYLKEQDYPQTFHENIIKESIEKYFPQFLGKPIIVLQETPHCLYKLDLVLQIPDIDHKIAIEISGICYTFDSGEMFGKKQIKFNLLRNHGWLPININIGTTIPHNLMSVASKETEASYARIASIIYEEMRKEIKSNLNITLPEGKISKWTLNKPKESVDLNNLKPKENKNKKTEQNKVKIISTGNLFV